MSCYFRHLRDIFYEAGIELASSNKKQIGQAIHRIAGTNYKDCPATWKRLKQQLIADEQKRQDFIAKLRDAVR